MYFLSRSMCYNYPVCSMILNKSKSTYIAYVITRLLFVYKTELLQFCFTIDIVFKQKPINNFAFNILM